jgi:hypothetical protein
VLDITIKNHEAWTDDGRPCAILGINDRSSQSWRGRLEDEQLPNVEGRKDGGLLRDVKEVLLPYLEQLVYITNLSIYQYNAAGKDSVNLLGLYL